MELLALSYHYIDEEDKYSSGIYPTSPERLSRQLELIGKSYSFISEDQLVQAIRGEIELSQRSCMVTFDDGVISQYEVAKPILEKYEVPAVIFIPTAHLHGKAYTVHKIHYLLSQIPEEDLLSNLEKQYTRLTGSTIAWDAVGLETITNWYRYDRLAAAKFKYALNHYLAEDMAQKLTSFIFDDLSDVQEDAFCKSFFVSEKEIRELSEHPLIRVGLHTHRHMSIVRSSVDAVARDIIENQRMLVEITGKKSHGIAYPFGRVTNEVFETKVRTPAHETGLTYGFTTDKKVNTDLSAPFLLGRYNPNDVTGGKKPIFEIT